MAVAWQAHGTLLGSTGADITPVIPAHVLNDILICHSAARSNAVTLATPAGWTLLHGPSDSGTTWRSYIFWKRAAGSAETNPLNDWSAVTGEKYGHVSTLRGAITTGSPFAASAITSGTADPGVATGVTTTEANQFVLTRGLVADNAASAVTTTATDPASFTQRSYTTITTGADAGQFATDATRATAGATGNVSHDFNGVPLAWSILVAAITVEPPATNAPNRTLLGVGT